MANVLFKKMSAAKFATITPDAGTLYRVITGADTQDFYLGSQKLNNVADITAAINALTAANIPVADAGDNFEGTDVEAVLAEIAASLGEGVEGKTIHLADESAGQTDFAKVYKIYQGADASDNTKNVLIGTINIPKDKVVQSGKVVTITNNQDSDGDATTGLADGTYIKIVLQNVTDPLYINATSLVDVYTAEQNATQIQLAVTNGVISAEIVDGSVDADALASNAVTTVKIADDAVTAAKIAIADHTESNTLGTDGISVSVKTTDGQVSGVTASIAAETYDDFGAAETAKSEVIGESTDLPAADTINGAKAYADSVVAGALTWEEVTD